MKIIKSLFAFAKLLSINSTAPTTVSFNEKWPQIVAYHDVILKSVQNNTPFVEAAKFNATILFKLSENLSVESMPEEFRNPKIIQTLLALKKHTKILDDLVKKKASDDEIKIVFTKVYDLNNQFFELCKK